MSIFLKESYGNSRLSAQQILRDPRLCLAFGFGSGLSKYMPGTCGSLAALPLYLVLQAGSEQLYIIASLICLFSGVYICDYAAKKLNSADFGGIVWDEIAGVLVTFYGLPFSWPCLLSGFALFRLFDIVKPWPIKWLDQHVHGGLGIMLDDLAAGLLATLVLRIWF